jgi:hypothetical protein
MIATEMTTTYQLIEILQQECLKDNDLMFTIIDEYVSSMNEDELKTLEDFVVNNFGE